MSSLLAVLRKRVSEIEARGPRSHVSPARDLDPPDDYEFDDTMAFRVAKDRVVSRWERWYVAELVRRHGGNLSRAARAARMDRTYLRELVLRYQVK